MALPYTVNVRCEAVNEYPTADIKSSTEYAEVIFKIDPDESSDDKILGPGSEDKNGRIRLLITQAQRDDFVEGNDYTISMSAA